ncbi:hypothetical protein [Halobacteriovorax sp.]|uniref:hypothetical protein n=1 Tax=Halobacteriovorax sp. TaxID=2020862 RepID=UPI003AF2A1BD
MKKLNLLIALLISTTTFASNSVTKNYYVKGMTCGGCILGVKVALKKAEIINFLEQDVFVGVVKIKFNKKFYSGDKTDCKVSEAIERYTEFKVFLDQGHNNLACKR